MLVSVIVVSLLLLEVLFSSLRTSRELSGIEMEQFVLGVLPSAQQEVSVIGGNKAVLSAEASSAAGWKTFARFLAPLCICRAQYF